MKKVVIIFLTLCFIFSVTACSKIDKADPNKTQYANNYPVVINGVTFTKAPNKIVSLSPTVTEILFEIGVGDKIVGRSDYCNYPEKASKITPVGSPANPDIKAIIALKPELVITQSPVASIDQNTLNKNGIQVLNLSAPKTYYEFVDIYGALGKVFFGNNKSDDVVSKAINPLDKALSNAQNLKLSNKFVFITTEQNTVATGDTLAGNILSVFGDNIAKEKLQYNMKVEEIVAAAPNVIFISSNIDKAKLPQQITALMSAQGVKVVSVDNSFFERPTSRLITVIDNILKEIAPPAETKATETSSKSE